MTALLLVAIVVPLLVPTYARVEPRLFGFPFFYWYQLGWVFLAAAFCGLSFWLLQRERAAYLRARGDLGSRAADQRRSEQRRSSSANDDERGGL